MSSAEGFDSITLTSADGSTTAEFVPGANLVCCSLEVDGVELLERRRGVRVYAEQGKTMGIPLLYPWANRLARFGYAAAGREVVLSEHDARIPRDSGGLPIHGVLPGLLHWEPADSRATDTLAARLDWSSAELLELFPFVHEVHCEATVGRAELTVTTTVTAVSEDRVPVSFGYHPYTRLPGVPRDQWQITLAASNRLVLDDHSIPTGDRAPVDRPRFPLAGLSLDDAFDAGPGAFKAAGPNASLTMEFLGGYGYAQVFSPDGQDFVCFEPMTAPTNALNSHDGLTVVPPGETYIARFRISFS
ncbi:MAG TPA: aldose 1-epimerase [Solirubrobacteraceae bacterium]|nr:aldose 1-epimerase [Solirubrobacteraceae bacterium]